MATGASSSEEQAALLAEQGKYAAAICRYKIAIAERPDCATLFEQLAQCLLETEQYPEAYQAASEALTLAPQASQHTLHLKSQMLQTFCPCEATSYAAVA